MSEICSSIVICNYLRVCIQTAKRLNFELSKRTAANLHYRQQHHQRLNIINDLIINDNNNNSNNISRPHIPIIPVVTMLQLEPNRQQRQSDNNNNDNKENLDVTMTMTSDDDMLYSEHGPYISSPEVGVEATRIRNVFSENINNDLMLLSNSNGSGRFHYSDNGGGTTQS